MFGFGRQYRCCGRYLTTAPASFTIGFGEDSEVCFGFLHDQLCLSGLKNYRWKSGDAAKKRWQNFLTRFVDTGSGSTRGLLVLEEF